MNFLKCQGINIILDLKQERLSMLIVGKSRMGKTYFMSQYAAFLLDQNDTVKVIDLGDKWSEKDRKRTRIAKTIGMEDSITVFFPSVTSLQGSARYIANAIGFVSEKVIELLKRDIEELSKNNKGFYLADLIKLLKEEEEIEAKKIYRRFESINGLQDIFLMVDCGEANRQAEESDIWNFAKKDEDFVNVVSQLVIYSLFETKKLQFRAGDISQKIFIFIDEFQNLHCRKSSIIGKCYTEGQKYGIYLVLATQFLQGKFDDAVLNQFQQGGFQLFFRLTDGDAAEISKRLHYQIDKQRELLEILTELEKGQFLLKGSHRLESCREITEKLRVVEVKSELEETGQAPKRKIAINAVLSNNKESNITGKKIFGIYKG